MFRKVRTIFILVMQKIHKPKTSTEKSLIQYTSIGSLMMWWLVLKYALDIAFDNWSKPFKKMSNNTEGQSVGFFGLIFF